MLEAQLRELRAKNHDLVDQLERLRDQKSTLVTDTCFLFVYTVCTVLVWCT